MQTSETRVIHQSTYTPIETKKDDSASKKPFQMQNVLMTAFNDQRIGRLVLEHMADLQHNPAYERFDHFEQLSSALNKIWTGDVAGSVSILRDLDTEEVVRFAREGIEAEETLLDKAQQDVQASFTAVSKRVQAKESRLIQQDVTSGMLRAEVAKTSPRSVAFLDVVGAFTTQTYNEVQNQVDSLVNGSKIVSKEQINEGAINEKNFSFRWV